MVSPRGLVWRISGSLAWRRPSRVTTRGKPSASLRFGMFTFSSHGAGAGGWRNTCSMMLRATRAAASSPPQPLSTCENAMAGIPNRKPSIAAATVPE